MKRTNNVIELFPEKREPTQEEMDAAFEALFREIHGSDYEEEIEDGDEICIVGSEKASLCDIAAAIAYAETKRELDPINEFCPYRAGELDEKTLKLLGRFELPLPDHISRCFVPESKGNNNIVLVNQNAAPLKLAFPKKTKVIEVLDVLPLTPELAATAPSTVRIEPLGSTGTLIFKLCSEKKVYPSPNASALLCAAILKDNHFFKNGNEPAADKVAAATLANFAGLDLEQLSQELI